MSLGGNSKEETFRLPIVFCNGCANNLTRCDFSGTWFTGSSGWLLEDNPDCG